jgi:hypothetical protein
MSRAYYKALSCGAGYYSSWPGITNNYAETLANAGNLRRS